MAPAWEPYNGTGTTDFASKILVHHATPVGQAIVSQSPVDFLAPWVKGTPSRD